MSEELKPCPFCNAQIAFEANEYGGDHYHPHNDCWLTGTLISGSWVSSPKWNRRASPTPKGRGGEREKGVSYEAWSRSLIGFIRERGLEMEFADWCGGWKCPIADDNKTRHLLSSPRVEDVRREALEEASALFENAAHTTWTGSEIADAIRALSPPAKDTK